MGEQSKYGKRNNRPKPEVEEKLQYTDHMSAIIKKAERDGHFDDLPGKGKPLDLGREYLNPHEAQFYKTLKDNHVLPQWVELAKEIEQFKEELTSLIDEKARQKCINKINKRIKKYNAICPPTLQKSRVND